MPKTVRAATLLALAILAACATLHEAPPTDLPEVRPGYVAGYLQPNELPDTLALLPKPPADNSPEHAADLAHYKSLASLQGGARWKQAAADAELRFPAAAQFFSCALDIPISREATPHLNMLLRRIRMDASRANDKPKEHYKRARPYQVTNEPSCEKRGRNPDSYPSGHASIGWAWALALAGLAPDRADRILARGYAYGESRAVCRMHWRSDLDAGRIVGAATIARLHAIRCSWRRWRRRSARSPRHAPRARNPHTTARRKRRSWPRDAEGARSSFRRPASAAAPSPAGRAACSPCRSTVPAGGCA